MNKKNAIKELKRIQKVEQELNVRIDNLENDVLEKEQINNELEQINNELEQINKEQQQNIKEQQQNIKEQQQNIKEQQQNIKEQKEEIAELKEETKEIRKVQEEQGIDIVALAKAINEMQDKKIVFEDEYAENEDKYNRIMKLIEDHPDLEHELKLGLGSCQAGMRNAQNSQEIIDEKINTMNNAMNDFFKFVKNNYQHI